MAGSEATASLANDAKEAVALILRAASERAANEVTGGADPELALRAVSRLADEAVHTQRNLEQTIIKAVDETPRLCVSGDASGDIDDDWLSLWVRLAEMKTKEEMQELFAKVLAGEAHRPGNFSPKTLEVISVMTPDVANKFEILCRLSLCVPEESTFVVYEVGLRSSKFLRVGGLNFDDLLVMQSSGLLMSAAGTAYTFDEPLSELALDYAGRPTVLRAREGNLQEPLPSCIFSPVGIELRRLIALEPISEYTTELKQILGAVGIDLVFDEDTI